MKVKNLLLAGLAVAAMTACSNENDEIVDNNTQPTGEKTEMKVNFTFANAVSRGVTDGGKDAGEDFEWQSSKVKIVVDYSNGTKRFVSEKLNLKKDPDNNNGTAVYTTDPFAVLSSVGGTNIYAFVNPTDDFAAKLETADLSTLTVNKIGSLPETLDYLTNTGLAANSNNFLMTGMAKDQKLTNGETVTVPITVSRVVAKLDELTDKTHPFSLIKSELTNAKDITVKIDQHSYSNLADESYALKATTSYNASFLQPYITAGKNADYKSYKWIDAKATYCYENFGFDTPTRVHYVGQVYYEEKAIEGNFYVWARYSKDKDETTGNYPILRTVYKDWATLAAENKELTNSEEMYTDKDLKDRGIKRYKAGRCYYEAEILTAESNSAEIIRNNWYKITVSSINDLGTPDPVKEDDKNTNLIIDAEMEPWKVNVNDVEL